MAAFTLGYAEKDLIELGFDAGPGRGGARAYVPREILLNSPELMKIGTLLSPAESCAEERLYLACQLAAIKASSLQLLIDIGEAVPL
jgi:hypothetical protein